MNVNDLRLEIFTSKGQALDKYWYEELKIEVPDSPPVVGKKRFITPLLQQRYYGYTFGFDRD